MSAPWRSDETGNSRSAYMALKLDQFKSVLVAI